MKIYDLIGIGFGPSNIALAITLEEQKQAGYDIESFFIEKQPGFAWHPNMLLDNAHMQVSFLKDLATMRNPSSRFTFINYLHQKNRLQDFINLKTFFPSRHEFNDYLAWAAAHFEHCCAYGEEVIEVLPEKRSDEVVLLRIRSRDGEQVIRERLTRNLVISIGGHPRVPDSFSSLQGNPRVFHSNSYLKEIAQHPHAKKIAVVGGGQSAAEIFMDLHHRSPVTEVDLIMRARAIKPSDDSPFVNEIFNTDFTDYVFNSSDQQRAEILNEFWHTNYAAPDLALIEQIFNVFYRQKVSGTERHRFLRRHEISRAVSQRDGIQFVLHDLNTDCERTETYDAVVLATGYDRDHHKSLLAPIMPYFRDLKVNRQYQLGSVPHFKPTVFLQGACESSHGLSDTLLSVTAVRTNEIAQALISTANQTATRQAKRAVSSALAY
ncbi:lysine N(6)-hydroxylase/L-ornithine N(5)-oxygenase family protein [Nitrosomonas communis]|uniref:lysine N(6)-hydroxylase/L-ornithine N(5)-oxygenase family protein n=1 Tax=Nitrosomonas communis TaxID=44574 RepID=UPI0026F2F06D|nr:lysine N(6)-hydroxylase/L-ornithine N(5)-oxygenase family protein [Nitrosomonas communis]MCO6427711.1 lysine N(6)-hydroxylase/L-ornithine N(5)-oxygenase family protein [Nitrosomonas communis]